MMASCGQQPPSTPVMKFSGRTMGTTYHITYLDSNNRHYATVIDSLLIAVNQSMSTYDKNSIISRFNSYRETGWFEVDQYFYEVFNLSKNIHRTTGGTFNPAVMPLVNFWGFGIEEINHPDESLIDSLLELVDFNAVDYKREDVDHTHHRYYIKKKNPNVSLDFSAIAKGYGADVMGEFFERQGIFNYMVEIGGEVRARGLNDKGAFWRIGIDKPLENAEREIQSVVELDNISMATSGNYRNFYERDGKRYVHTINPRTGYPEVNTTLSVSVFTKECAVADAYATAFMVMGQGAGGMSVAAQLPEIEAYFIYNDRDGYKTVVTEGLKDKISEITD